MKMYISNYLNDFVSSFDSFEEDWNLYDGIEDKDCYKYEFNLAGIKKKNIKVNIDNNVLRVEAKQDDREYLKSYHVPHKADATSAVAKYENGLLLIKINKKESAKSIELDIV